MRYKSSPNVISSYILGMLSTITKLGIIFGGIQFLWSIQIGNVSPYLIELGLPNSKVGIVWLAGPISGLVMQPLIAYFSDRHSRRGGKRRPFIIISAMTSAISSIIFGISKDISDNNNSIVIIIAIISFWCLDLSINATMIPLRALLSDIVPISQQTSGNAMFSLMISCGNMIGYALGAFTWQHYLSSLGSNVKILFCLGAFVIMMCSLVCYTIQEKKYSDVESGQLLNNSKDISERKNIFQRILSFPPLLYRVWIIQLLTFVGWFVIMMFATAWVALEIFHGNPNADKGSADHKLYKSGVRAGNLGLFLQATVAALISLILPKLTTKFGYKLVWFLPTLLFSLVLLIAPMVKTRFGAVFLLTLLGPAWATTMTMSWSLSSILVSSMNDRALYLSILNASQCFPEIFASIFSSVLLNSKHDLAFLFQLGGIAGILASLVILTVPYSQILAKNNSHSQ